jgi:hypothetical protein
MLQELKRAAAGLIVAAASAGQIVAQAPALRPVFDAFEVATVKPTPPDLDRRTVHANADRR